ncbi:MAG: HAD family hydrolase [Myxococcota bacterium]
MDLTGRAHWIFDMDGTLTVAMHDFDAIRSELGLPAGKPILEELATRPESDARALFERLDRLELELARRARAAAGAVALLETLVSRSARLGILTRNSHANALETLRACGLERFFEGACIVGREAAAPKPDPGGIHHLLDSWRAAPRQAVMVGDYRYDLLAGRAAGTATVYVDSSGSFPFAEHADVSVQSLAELAALLE